MMQQATLLLSSATWRIDRNPHTDGQSSDVDLDNGTLTVRKALTLWKQFGKPNSKKGKRTMQLDAGIVAILRKHKAAQTEARLRADSEWRDAG